jgi:hypothetical protein
MEELIKILPDVVGIIVIGVIAVVLIIKTP